MDRLDSSLFLEALDSTRDGLVITEKKGYDHPIIYANPAFEKITGYCQSEIIGRDCRFLQGEQTNKSTLQVLRKALDQGKSVLVTVQNFRKDGTMFWNELSVSPIKNQQGELTHFVGIQKDVTQQIDLQRKLTETNRRLNTLLLQLEAQNKQDELTGLYNRKVLTEEVAILLEGSKRTATMVSVMFIDIDHFKSINDNHGHQAGDACLRHLAQILKSSLGRLSDVILRYGGEEFVVISPATSLSDTLELAEHIRQTASSQPVKLPNTAVQLTFTLSIGVACRIPGSKDSIEDFLHEADKAMYEAKAHGRNRVMLSS